jgi:ABC-type glycerol-3-phosphate transport system permease component
MFAAMVYPFLYMINYSISTPGKIRGTLLLLPTGLNLDSYIALLKDPSVFRALLISVSRSVLGPVGMMMVSGMAGYVLSKKNLVFGKFIRMFMFFTMYFSAGIIPVYLLIQSLKLTGSYWVYIFPALVSPFNIVLIKTYIESIPDSLEEAVLIDGGTDFDVYFRCIIHVCLPVNAAVILFSAIGHWNSFIDTQLYNYANPELYTIQYVLFNTLGSKVNQSLEQAKQAGLLQQVRINAQSMKMAISVITIVPIMCVYPFLQRYFVSGLMVGSIKA